ncbi:tetratricopeptide repeat protein [Caldovatus aquaticus]|uniref:Tetratricopeptide repeat protein n=1 Tax=Caldovatus aquaticus TaxID=2865671 RepID=A0ABS7F5C9_9PROT|nr:tetratricopeptide repeat protein [Caldovatus aquaticus]MBW8270508.1 tetratricopeptide repeat protein [Caldovatus aquaticus]
MTGAILLYESAAVRLFHRPGPSDFTLIAFAANTAPVATQGWASPAIAGRPELDLLAVTAERMHWYPAAAVAALLPVARAAAKPRRLTLGVAMGGYAALKYGAALGAAAAIAFSPQASLDPADAAFDDRARLYFRRADHRGHRVQATDLPPATLLAYDPLEPTEARHAALLSGLPGVVRAPLPHAGHAGLRILGEGGDAPALFALALAGRMEEAARLLRAARRRSPRIWLALGLHAQRTGRLGRMAALLARALPPAAGPPQARRAGQPGAPPPGGPGPGRAPLAAPAPAAPPPAAVGPAADPLARLHQRLARNPRDEAAHIALVNALAARGDKPAALAAARAAAAALPESGRCQARLGQLLAERHPAEAVPVLQAAMALGHATESVRHALVHALVALGRNEEALAAAREAVAALPDSQHCQAQLGLLALRTDPAEAVAALQAAIALGNAQPGVAHALAHGLLALGRREAAIAALREAVARLPGSLPLWMLLARLLEQEEDWPAAEQALRTVLTLDENNADAHLHLSEALRRQKRIREAVAAFRRGEALGPDRELLRIQRYRMFGELG